MKHMIMSFKQFTQLNFHFFKLSIKMKDKQANKWEKEEEEGK